MQATDKVPFAALILKTWRFYGKTPDGEEVAGWYELLEGFALEAVAAAFKAHLTDPDRGQYLPKPADVIRHLPAAAVHDGRPGPDEAWGLLLRFVNDEADTGVYTEEMRHGWQACDPILKQGDEIGARRCFLDAYSRAVQDARQQRQSVRWNVTLGHDPQLRIQRLNEAVAAGRLSADHARALLPGPTPTTISQVAGLLEGPVASAEEQRTAERLRALAQLLNASSAEAEQRRAEERQRQRDAEEARRQELMQQWAILEQREADRRDAA